MLDRTSVFHGMRSDAMHKFSDGCDVLKWDDLMSLSFDQRRDQVVEISMYPSVREQ